MKKIIILFISIIFISGCGTAEFTRVGISREANLLSEVAGVRVYMNRPPEDIKYKSLGWITTKGNGYFFMMRYDNAMRELIYRAKGIGANGIIDWRMKHGFFSLEMEGEAVVFDECPEDQLRRISAVPPGENIKSAVVHYESGNKCFYKGQYDIAIFEYSKTIEIDASFVNAYKMRGNAYSQIGQYNLAIADDNRVLEINPEYARVYLYKAIAYEAAGFNNEAIESYQKFIEFASSQDVQYLEKAKERIQILLKSSSI